MISKRSEDATAHTCGRYAQFQSALSHDTTMMIWLGKQLLGQKDKQEVTFTGLQKIIIKIDSVESAGVLNELINGTETDQRSFMLR